MSNALVSWFRFRGRKTFCLSKEIIATALVFCSAHAFCQSMSNVPPSVTITDPPSGAVYTCSSLVRLKATAADIDGTIQQVDFYSAGNYDQSTNLLGSVSQAPYNLILTNSLCATGAGFYHLSAVATDDQGARSTSAPVRIDFPQDPYVPRVSIAQPKDGDAFSTLDVVTIKANVVTFFGSERPVYFFSDGQPIGTVAPPPYTLSVTNFPPGEHLLKARYVDENLNVGTSPPIRIVVRPFRLLAVQVSQKGQFSFKIEGLVTGNSFQIEASSNLLNWFPLSSNIASSNSFQFVDPTPANLQSRFYRGFQGTQ